MNPLLELEKQGQSIWFDFITRELMAKGELQRLINEDGLKGVTSNPTIFQKAISASKDYDGDVDKGLGEGKDADVIFDSLAIADIQRACDLFRPVYDRLNAKDGYVSLEVNPHWAGDGQKTLEEARRLFKAVNRPNVMIKIPATQEGLFAIEKAIGEGININITLIFSLERYQKVIDAWLAGLENLDRSGKPIKALGSVASFFVSRVDSLVDKLLDAKIVTATGDQKKELESLRGKAAIANAQQAYQLFLKAVASPRYQALAAKGAQVQRPLWASTGTKNPAYRDVMYLEELIGKDTVNTVPPQTLDAFRDHGKARASLTENPAHSVEVLARVAKAGIKIDEVTLQLEKEGVQLFIDSYDQLTKSIRDKKNAMQAKG